MDKIYFELDTGKKLKIKADLRFKESTDKNPLVIISHGFKGYRNWGFFPYLSEKLSENNMPVINFDFSQNGILDENEMIYDLEIFRKITISQEITDLSSLIYNLLNQKISKIRKKLDKVWNGEIYLIGHSLGGAISIIVANKFQEIKKLSLWASISKFDRNTQRQKYDWRQKGVLEFLENSTGQKLILDVEYLNDREENNLRFDIQSNIKTLQIPISIVHGILDITVPIKEAEVLFDNIKDKNHSKFVVVPKVGHTFGVTNRFSSTNNGLELAINETINFFKN